MAAEHIESNQESQLDFLRRFVAAVAKAAPNHLNDTLVTAVEINLNKITANYIAAAIATEFRGLGHRGRVVHMRQRNGDVGVLTTHDVKQQMALDTERMLRENLLLFDARMQSATREKSALDVQTEMCRELESYRRIVHSHTHAHTGVRTEKILLSGKVGSDQDDLAITTQMAIYWSKVFLTDDTYAEVR